MRLISIILIAQLCFYSAQSISSAEQCSCKQLLNEQDCRYFEFCSWSTLTSQCRTKTSISTTQTSAQTPNTRDSENIWCAAATSQAECQSKPGCAFIGTSCTTFPGCTPFVEVTYEACQIISKNCVSNGIACVFRDSCQTYINQTSCVKNSLPDSQNNFCYWNTAFNSCEDANTCLKLPKYLITDAMCRKYINYCTVHQSGSGCVASGYNCSDQETEQQCVWNHSMTIKCFWFGKCLDQSCENEPSSYTTIAECTKRLKECIPKQGGGCKVKGNCESIDLPDQCVKDSIGGICHWHDNKCQDYTCLKASTSLKTHNECSTYKSSCTVNANKGGCEDRTIENAPLEFKTTKECQEYITGSQAKATGGCKPLGGCSTIEIKDDCKVDYQKKQCFWNENATINKCNYLQCNLAPGPGFTDQYCNSFSTDCIAVGNYGCQDKKCHLITNRNFCDADINNKSCHWTSECVLKLCSQASSTSTTYSQCQEWSSRCTVNYTLNGCIDLQQQCGSYSISEQCRFLKDGTICVWDGVSQCFKKSCTTAFPITNYTTTSSCNSYITGCVVANSGQGCVNKITQCVDSLIQDNCLSPCVWNAITKCQVKQCNNADSSKTTTTLCDGWISGCIVNATNNGCIDKPATCTGQTQQQCNIKSKSTGDCYYNGSTCVDLTCDNTATTVTTHSGCQTILNTCTLKANQQGCMTIPSTCSGLIEQQCYLKTGGRCFWASGVCRDKLCSDATTTANFDTHDECTAFDPQCTVTTVFSPEYGCLSKTYPAGATPTTYANCIDAPQSDCVKSTNQGECYYNAATNQCTQKSCANIPTTPTSYSDCYNWLGTCIYGLNICKNALRVGADFQDLVPIINCLTKPSTDCTPANLCALDIQQNKCYDSLYECEQFSITNCGNFCKVEGGVCIRQGEELDCRKIKQESNCTYSAVAYKCIWQDNQCAFFNNCSMQSSDCQFSTWLCTNDGSSIQCKLKTAYCSDHLLEKLCTFTIDLKPCHWNGSSCVDLDCSKADSTSITTCINYNKSCLKQERVNACKQRPESCSDILNTQENCHQPTNLGTGLCFWNGSGCVDRLCSHYTGTFNHTNCQSFMYSCTSNNAATSCISKSNDCTTYLTSDSCKLTLNNKVCDWNGSICSLKTCESAPQTASYDNDTKCQTWISTCGSRPLILAGCVVRQATCSAIINQSQCYRNLADAKCYWDANTSKCVDDICTSYPGTSAFDSHSKCFAMNNTCTVKATGQTTTQGCMDLSSNCNDYTAQDQCNFTQYKVSCIWNASITPSCQIKSCLTAPHTTSYDDHTKCSAYFKDTNNKEICTVGPNGGCIFRNKCNQYTLQKQCVVDNIGTECAWNGVKCDNKSCTTAGTDINDHAKCQEYIKTCLDLSDPNCVVFNRPCTVNSTNNGCINIPSSCDGLTKHQCHKNAIGGECYWNSSTTKCYDFNCLLAPKSSSSDADCQTFNSNCLFKQNCSYKLCEQFTFTDDGDCEKAQQGCTSNGISCIPRLNCTDSKVKQSCTKDINGNQCQWSVANEKCSKVEIVTTINCSSALTTMKTEKECNTFLNGCTAKQGGGCVSKSTCADAKIQEACTSDVSGSLCFWTGYACRIKECIDFEGTTYETCQLVGGRLDCMSDGQGKCMKSKKCNEIDNIKNCYQGSDGQCLWVVGVNSIGRCYQYNSCNSIPFTTHSECQLVSRYCTSDSTTCVPIGKCSDNNPRGGCVIGNDGDCQLVLEKPQTCKLFKSCEEIKYLTHTECQQAQSKCTSDGIHGCLALNKCNLYKYQESCRISSSLTQCIWDETICRDRQCSDLNGSTHQLCHNQFPGCTTNGDKCVPIQNCNTYAKELCQVAQSPDGKCIWNNSKCREVQCEDLINSADQTTCSKFKNCRLDGTKCVNVLTCLNYIDSKNCYLNGSDGQCTWDETSKQCSLMTQCESANSDMQGCLNNKDKCHWTPVTEISKSTCTPHTCATVAQGSQCKGIPNWNNTQHQFCTLNTGGVCTQIIPSELSESQCFTMTLGTYVWSDSLKLCKKCTGSSQTNDSKFISSLLTLIVALHLI